MQNGSYILLSSESSRCHSGLRVAAKLEWADGDEERVECAIHFAITQHIPTDAAVTLAAKVPYNEAQGFTDCIGIRTHRFIFKYKTESSQGCTRVSNVIHARVCFMTGIGVPLSSPLTERRGWTLACVNERIRIHTRSPPSNQGILAFKLVAKDGDVPACPAIKRLPDGKILQRSVAEP